MWHNKELLSERLYNFAQSLNYSYTELRFQKIMGPPMDANYARDVKGCEVFVSRLPGDAFFETLFPIFSNYGRIYQIRVMLTSNGLQNKGLTYISYYDDSSANNAIQALNDFEIVPGHHIKVEISLDNRRLYVGGVPHNKLRDEIWKELVNQGMQGIVDVIVYRSYTCPWHNRGFAFVEFESHQRAALVKAAFQKLELFRRPVTLDWSVPLCEVSDEVLKKTCKIFLRCLPITLKVDDLTEIVKSLVSPRPVLKVYKFKDYAFAHFYNRSDAEIAFSLLRVHFAGSPVEVEWGKPPRLLNKPWFRNEKIGYLAAKRQYRQEQMYTSSQQASAPTCTVDAITNSLMFLDINSTAVHYSWWSR